MNIAVIYGGLSCEHDVSVITAAQIMENIDKKHNAIPVYIKEDKFYIPKEKSLAIYSDFNAKNFTECIIKGNIIYTLKGKKISFYKKIDVCLLAAHGGVGEDGSLQGYLEINRLPYISSDVASSAVTMDKVLQKKLFLNMGLPVIDFVEAEKKAYEKNKNTVIKKIEKSLDYPIIVKPAKLGSSIGITFSRDKSELEKGLELAFMYDETVILEKALENITECNCAAFACRENVFISCIEKPVKVSEFLTFKDKYIQGSKSKNSPKRECPAKISVEIAKVIRRYTMDIYKGLKLGGIARIDFIVDKDDNVFVNEVNSIPGSLAYYLFEPQGITFKDLINLLIDNCIYRSKEKEELLHGYDSNILNINPKFIKGK